MPQADATLPLNRGLPPPPPFALATPALPRSPSWTPFDIRCGGSRPSLSPRARQSSGVGHSGKGHGVSASRVADFLYVGALSDALNADFLDRHKITRIINLSGVPYWTHGDVTVKQYNIDDTADAPIARLFMPCAAMINEARREWAEGKSTSILIHCQQGRSRSVTIAAAYFIICNGWTVAESLSWLARCRPCTEPNMGFVEALRRLQEGLTDARRSAAKGRLCAVVRATATPDVVEDALTSEVGMVWQVVQYESSRSLKEGSADASGGVEESQLLVVFFASAESVSSAVKLWSSHPQRFASLGIERIIPYPKKRATS